MQRPLQYHYRPRQLAVLAVLTLAWLLVLALGFASAALLAGSDLAFRGITTKQRGSAPARLRLLPR